MGRYSKGILGPFSGKVGTVIGSTWKGIDYMRSLPKPSSKVATQAQLEQRVKFMITVGFLKPINPLVNYGLKNVAGASTGFNVAVARVLKNGITGIYPDYQIEYNKVFFSEGPLSIPSGIAVSSADPGKLRFDWADNTTSGLASATDKAIFLIYDPVQAKYIYTLEGASRSAISQELDVIEFAGNTVHCWMAFHSADGKTISTSVYAGSVTIA